VYVYILFSIISGEHTLRIQKNYDKLVLGMSAIDDIVDQLISDEVLNTDDSIEILSKVVPSEMSRSLIEKIRDRTQYDKFIAALKYDSVNAKLADDIEQIDVTEHDMDVLQSQTGYYCFKNLNIDIANIPHKLFLVNTIWLQHCTAIAKKTPYLRVWCNGWYCIHANPTLQLLLGKHLTFESGVMAGTGVAAPVFC